MSDAPPSSVPPSSAPGSRRGAPLRRQKVFERIASIGASAQAAIPGLYAWAITVAPAAWSRGASPVAKVAACVGVLALVTAPLVEGAGPISGDITLEPAAESPKNRSQLLLERVRSRTGPTRARLWSVWGFALSSAIVWALVPSALSSAHLDGLRGALGMVGWALFAFASAGPALRSDPAAAARIVASTSLKPRSELPRGDGAYVVIGVVLALAMQVVGWGVAVPERAVLVRLVTVVCGIAVLGATTSIALARHSTRVAPTGGARLRRALPWLVMLVLFTISGLLVGMAR
ncbi:MAG TPA: hypothetical protein VM925_22575 [Labilithrix sp.]|nr:hypothetical protein [Labilithrix sp.]